MFSVLSELGSLELDGCLSVGASLTVADSKRAFHQAFPYVIAPLYLRLVD